MPHIDGYFLQGRPFVKAELVIPRLRLGGEIDFLVDTGSEASVVQGSAARPLLRTPSADTATVLTPLGSASSRIEQALVVFRYRGNAYAFEVRLLIPDSTPATLRLPSLLGRDVLNRMDMAYSPLKERLRLRFDSADQVVRGA